MCLAEAARRQHKGAVNEVSLSKRTADGRQLVVEPFAFVHVREPVEQAQDGARSRVQMW